MCKNEPSSELPAKNHSEGNCTIPHSLGKEGMHVDLLTCLPSHL